MKKNRNRLILIASQIFMIATLILVGLSFSVNNVTSDSDRIAAKTEKLIEKRVNLLDKKIATIMVTDKDTWASQKEVPNDMVVYRYIDEELQSWYNQFPVRNDDIRKKLVFQRISKPAESINSPLADVTPNLTFENYGPKWYLVKSSVLGARKIVAGLEIMDTSNETSVSSINENIRCGRSYTIVPLSESGGSVVTYKGAPLFKILGVTSGAKNAVSHSTIIWLTFAIICFLLSALLFLFSKRTIKRATGTAIVCTLGILIFNLIGERIQDNSPLFSPNTYADGHLLNSLGAVVNLSLIVTCIILCIFLCKHSIYRRALSFKKKKKAFVLMMVTSILMFAGLVLYINGILRSILLNSSITLELYRLNDLSIYSFVTLITIIMLMMMVPLILNFSAIAAKRLWGWRIDVFSAWSRNILSGICAIYLVATSAILGFQKETDRVNIWANRLAMDRDISLELELGLHEDKIASDQQIAILSSIKNSNYIILNRIIENYFFRITKNYDIVVELFPENETDQRVITYLKEKVANGRPINKDSKFMFVRDANGNNMYTGVFAYYNPGKGTTIMLVTVSPKSNREDKGYAKILGFSVPGSVIMPAQYSYARYSNGKLVSFKGNYAYPTKIDDEFSEEFITGKNTTKSNGNTHFVNQVGEDDIIVISRETNDRVNYLVTLLFLNLVFNFHFSIFVLIRRKVRRKEKNYYKSTINAAMLIALVMTMIILASVSVLFVNKRNNSNLHSLMADKVNSLQTLLQSRLRYFENINDILTQEGGGIIENVSNTLKSDITLYTMDGKEFYSTTPEMFDRMILGTRINESAYDNIIQKNRRFFINKERIANQTTYFLYAPLFNVNGEMLAIFCSPFTDDNFDFRAEAVLHSFTIITVFMILLLLARTITASAVDKMFKPISEMGRKMNEIRIDNLEYIIYERDDEVSRLVKAYNLMVHDLYNSTKQLTLAERDKAWATMARQVAHEIKNPLTPIKLQIQRLIRMKNNNNPGWTEKFDDISKEVLKQIDLLADTANEFSTFAKLYTEEAVSIDLDNLIKEEISLFDSRDNIKFSYMGLDGAKVVGPKPQLTRVFVNLIGNAVQAIENTQIEDSEAGREILQGRIMISLRLSVKEGFYDIVFEDNGPGVKDEDRVKLFTPNFTTKSNGTGLGLSICRNILEKCNGEILYSKSFTLKGACFTVRFPISQ